MKLVGPLAARSPGLRLALALESIIATVGHPRRGSMSTASRSDSRQQAPQRQTRSERHIVFGSEIVRAAITEFPLLALSSTGHPAPRYGNDCLSATKSFSVPARGRVHRFP
jgi:hypothetical protein